MWGAREGMDTVQLHMCPQDTVPMARRKDNADRKSQEREGRCLSSPHSRCRAL
jgi:hypothetical protein